MLFYVTLVLETFGWSRPWLHSVTTLACQMKVCKALRHMQMAQADMEVGMVIIPCFFVVQYVAW